ncbi:hypothetical protein GGI15_002349, partial [Coemansia interrupta]
IGPVDDALFARWWDVCDAVARFERAQRRMHAVLLVTYVRVASEKLLAQRADFDPEAFLAVVAELLTEYRKRRPDYEAIAVAADGSLQPGAAQTLDRRTCEDIGSEFDRLFAWVDQQLPAASAVRALLQASSPKGGRTPSWQNMAAPPPHAAADKMRSTSAASVGYGSASNGNRVASPLPPMPGGAGSGSGSGGPSSATREGF